MKRIIYFVFPLSFLWIEQILSQAIIPLTVIGTNSNTIRFDNGDSLVLPSGYETSDQLIFAMFHAEEDTIRLDPGLSLDGRWRAINLNKLLSPFKPINAYTTPFRKDILTLQPLTDHLKIKVNYYDQSALNVLYESLENDFPGTCVIVGHSQTIGRIFEFLTSIPFTEALDGEPSDRLFLIHRKKNAPGQLYSWQYRIR